MRPKIETITFCWNERPLLPFAMHYWRQYASTVTVIDNGSTDGSLDYLLQYKGYVRILNNDTGNMIDNDRMRKLKNNIWKKSTADFVVVCDLDEMLVAKDIMSEFERMKDNNCTVCMQDCYTMMSETMPIYTGRPLHEIRPMAYRSASKTLIFNPHALTNINYTIGAHTAYPEGQIKYYIGGIYMYHAANNLSLDYKIERYKQLNNRRRDAERAKHLSVHYGQTEEQIKENWEKTMKRTVDFRNILDKHIR